jgi:hypothetical protein
MTKSKVGIRKPSSGVPIKVVREQKAQKRGLTKWERIARRQSSQSIRVASFAGISGPPSSSGSITTAESSFYSPQLSTDFLEQPQSERERRELYRFWYQKHPIVGSAIDFHCFPPGAPVQMLDGTVRPIESLKVGESIRNGLGEPSKIVNTFKNSVNSHITSLKVRGVQDKIDCTPNHPFLVYRAEQIDCKFPIYGIGACKSGRKSLCKQKKCLMKDFGSPQFIFACDLKVGDYICSPSMTGSDSVFTRDELRILGYYASEGSISRTKRGSLDRAVFTLNANESDTIAEEISQIYSARSGRKATKKIILESNSCYVKCYSKEFAEFCHDHAGVNSREKRLSLDVMNSPREDILEFLGAYYNGDGSLTKNGYVATTTSEFLAHQVYALGLKVGYTPTLHKSFPEESTGFKYNGPVYKIYIPYRYHEEFSKYANFIGDNYSSRSTREYCIKVGSNTLRRIEEVSTVPYEGFVYNIEVDGEGDRKSYVAYGLATHNTDIPMSKIRLSLPKGSDLKRNKQILHFYEKMCDRINLFKTLYDATHEYWLQGVCYLFCEDHDLSESLPEEFSASISEKKSEEEDYVGRPRQTPKPEVKLVPEEQSIGRISKFVQENYKGWERIQIIPPEQIKTETFQYTNKSKMELLPSDKDKLIVSKAEEGDEESKKIADDIADEIKENLLSGKPIPLNTSPYDNFLCSSFCFTLAHKKSGYGDKGISLLERCMTTLLYADKLRQAQTSIASRAMTPKRIVWGDKLSIADLEDLRSQVEQALMDPDFTIVSNYEIHWDEIGSRDRLLDLSTEYELTNKLLYIGLRVTESMLTGESSYSGERIHLDVMNTMYLLFRESIVNFVEKSLFEPVADKKGFWEVDEFGNRNLIYPRLQFTRLALRDNSEMQDFLFNLYQKGSLPVHYILELLNIDSAECEEQLKKDMYGPSDSTFNEFLRAVLQKVGDKMVDESDVMEQVAKKAGLAYNKGGKKKDRFDEVDS